MCVRGIGTCYNKFMCARVKGIGTCYNKCMCANGIGTSYDKCMCARGIIIVRWLSVIYYDYYFFGGQKHQILYDASLGSTN